MSHGFTRFGPPSARERFRKQARGGGTFAMLLPTILATLFMFTVVVTLNKATSLTRGGEIVRLLNVDDVFPTQLDVEQNRKKEFWELMPPPPSPDAVLADDSAVLQGITLYGSLGPEGLHDSRFPPPEPDIAPLAPTTVPGFAPTTTPAPRITAPSAPRTTSIPTPEIQLPVVSPDTSLPVVPSTP